MTLDLLTWRDIVMETKDILSNGTFKVFVSRPYDEENEPNKYWKNLFLKGIKPVEQLVTKKTGYKIQLYEATDNPQIKPVDIKVFEALDNSDIFLCLLTDFRSCVLFETGYARKLGLPL